MDENQNTNEQEQAKKMFAEEETESSKPAETSPLSSHEIKEEIPILSTQTQTSSIEPQTDSMEVHKHPHHVMHSKKWSEYLLEFFMLFLAVFLGFVAENIREGSVERDREKEYMQSMVTDMKSDIKQLDSLVVKRQVKQQMIDSILLILDSPDPDLYGNQLYYFARWMPRPLRIISSDGTIQELKNGNLRLIRNRKVVDAIIAYDQLIRFQDIAVEDREESLIQQFYPSLKKLFDPRIFEKMVNGMRISRPEGDPKMLHKDKESLDELYSHIHFLKNVNSYNLEFELKRRDMAKHVLNIIQQEYHLGNE